MIKFELVGEKIDIEDLQYVLNESEWSIKKEDSKYYLCTKTLNATSEKKEIVSKTKHFLDLLNGAASIVYKDHQTVGLGSLIILDDNCKRHITVFTGPIIIRGRSRARANLTLIKDGIEIKDSQPTTVESWLIKSQNSNAVQDALHFFNQTTWWNLYKVYEVILDDVGNEKRLSKFADSQKLKVFRKTANSRTSVGDHARHAKKEIFPPKETMGLDEAYSLMKQLFEAWIRDK